MNQALKRRSVSQNCKNSPSQEDGIRKRQQACGMKRAKRIQLLSKILVELPTSTYVESGLERSGKISASRNRRCVLEEKTKREDW